MTSIVSLLTFGLVAAPLAFAHPGHDIVEEAAERAAFLKRSPNSVSSCASKYDRRDLQNAAMTRRQNLARDIRAMKGITSPIVRRDFAAYNSSHEASGVSFGDDETLLFTDNSTCILQPEVTQGPYYVDGELIRSNVTEDQQGVPLYLDVQLIDTSSCEPVPAVFMDLWHCNATGVYSGVSANGNGDSSDTSNIDNTWLRGIVQTDSNGVAQFETIFPGHYTGRATHIHILAHNANDTTIRTNGTLLGSNFTQHASHVGQFFFDQDLISLVEATEPYASNTQDHTSNADDMILSQEAASMDPFVEWIMVGEDISDGILGWISIGIDPTSSQTITSAGTSYKDGGVANPNGGMGGPGGSGGGGPPSGTGGPRPSEAQSGAIPSGTPPS